MKTFVESSLFLFIFFSNVLMLNAMEKEHAFHDGVPRSLTQTLDAMQKDDAYTRAVTVYVHGFGESIERNSSQYFYLKSTDYGKIIIPEFPDAPAKLNRAGFYTSKSVHVLASSLKKAVDGGVGELHIAGHSNGGGILLNCLARLVNYEQKYFEGVDITENDAKKIIAAVNRGSLLCNAPLLDLTKARPIVALGSIFGTTALCALCGFGYYYAVKHIPAFNAYRTVFHGALGFGTLYYLLGKAMQISSIASINYASMPIITNNNYDPYELKPISAAPFLNKKLTCPILLHFHRNDGVVSDPDEDTIVLYEQIKNEKTHILISDDASHNSHSAQFDEVFFAYKRQYMSKHGALENDAYVLKATQPTVEELHSSVFLNFRERWQNRWKAVQNRCYAIWSFYRISTIYAYARG